MADSKVLLTGAAGTLGKWLRPQLIQRFGSIRSSDLNGLTPIGPNEEIAVVDLADGERVDELVRGVSAIVHFGGISREDSFQQLLGANFLGTYNLFDAARRHKVDRIVFASSAHVTGFTPVPERIDGTAAHRPDTLYGVSKCFGEDLGRYYAEKFGMDVACLRIGWAIPEPINDYGRLIWLSYPDLFRMIEACLTATRFGFAVLYGASDLEHGWWHNEPYQALGFTPTEQKRALAFRSQVDPGYGARTDERFHGGDFAGLGYNDRLYVHAHNPPPTDVDAEA